MEDTKRKLEEAQATILHLKLGLQEIIGNWKARKGSSEDSWHRDDYNKAMAIKELYQSILEDNPAQPLLEELAALKQTADSLNEIINYDGGADNALEDEYVIERAKKALALTPYGAQPKPSAGESR